MIRHVARQQHDIAGAHVLRAEMSCRWDAADAGRGDVQAIRCPLSHHLRVAGDQPDAGKRRGFGHVAGDLAQLVDREALLDDERRRQPHRLGAGHSKVVDGAVHGEVADGTAGKLARLHHERVGRERQSFARGQGQCGCVGQRGAITAGEGLDEHGIDQSGRRLAACTVSQRDHLVGEPRPAPPIRLDAVEDGCLALAHARHRGSPFVEHRA